MAQWGAERAGVGWGIPERLPAPTSPSHRFAMGPSLSPLKGGEGLFTSLRDVRARHADPAAGAAAGAGAALGAARGAVPIEAARTGDAALGGGTRRGGGGDPAMRDL